MPKSIWIINDYAGSIYHGMEFRNYYIARELVKKGHKVYIISASFMHLFKKLPEVKDEYTFENIDGIEYIWIKVPHYKSSTDKKRVLKWFVFFKKLYSLPTHKMQNPDFVVVSPMAPFHILPGYRFAKKFGAKLIYEVKDIWPLSLMELGGYSKNHPFIMFMQWFANFAYKKSDLTISALSNSYEYMKDYGLKKERFKFIPNGISLQDMKNIKPLNEKTKKELPKDKFLVGYTGTIGIANALDNFIRAGKFLKDTDINLVLIGDGKERTKLQNLAKELNLNNITFIDPIPKDEVQSALKEFDACYIGLQKKRIFTFGVSPNKLYDYLYSAKPIVYAINDKNSIIDRANCGISVDVEDPKSIADGILWLYEMDQKQREQMGKSAKEYVLNHHSFESIADKFIKTLEEL